MPLMSDDSCSDDKLKIKEHIRTCITGNESPCSYVATCSHRSQEKSLLLEQNVKYNRDSEMCGQ